MSKILLTSLTIIALIALVVPINTHAQEIASGASEKKVEIKPLRKLGEGEKDYQARLANPDAEAEAPIAPANENKITLEKIKATQEKQLEAVEKGKQVVDTTQTTAEQLEASTHGDGASTMLAVFGLFIGFIFVANLGKQNRGHTTPRPEVVNKVFDDLPSDV